MKTALLQIESELESIRQAGTWREERIITTPQSARIDTTAMPGVLNMCANNYLGLADNPELIRAAKQSYDRWGFGLSSVRFICGTQELHKQLEKKIAGFLGTDDAILYSSCFDANGGLFETLLGPEDAVVSDELNHASIIDGIRLCKAARYRYRNSDMEDLRLQLTRAREAGARRILIATDGVFSMDGYLARLPEICDLADEFDALTMVDDSHAVGFMGPHGRGTPEHFGVTDRIDILTGTFGKALGGASGGYTAARRPIVELLRQRSRPYLFSNTVAPAICAATLRAVELLEESDELRKRVHENARFFREGMEAEGFDLLPGEHPIVPVMLYDPHMAHDMASRLLQKGVYVVAFCYPVVPKGRDRIRTQISAGHTREDLEFAVRCFAETKREMKLSGGRFS
ncbi:MAG: glycine C-acetyltransferase [Oscillospiraceae bacterium]|nr:glycine C-acetyltransferase [Oscillospiraceae bacterium]